MREIVLDTETTGLDPKEGHRIIEIGCLELYNHVPTGKVFHHYINPERDISPDAFAISGLSWDFLKQHPLIIDILDDFLAFIGKDPLVIHNAKFDLKFLNAELGWAGKNPIADNPIIDTLDLARRKFPGAPASLDALCKRFHVDNSKRAYHGALLDSELLADVYLELIGGRQRQFFQMGDKGKEAIFSEPQAKKREAPINRDFSLTEEEKKNHEDFIKTHFKSTFWRV